MEVRTLHFLFINKFTKKLELTIDMPYNPYKAMNGYYHRFYNRIKNVLPFGGESHLIKGKKWVTPTKSDRILFDWHNGCKLDMPHDVDAQDMKIILHYLEGLKMARS